MARKVNLNEIIEGRRGVTSRLKDHTIPLKDCLERLAGLNNAEMRGFMAILKDERSRM